jgi:hypothetical protein
MANLQSVFEIKAQLRPCLVHVPTQQGYVPALWHCWAHEAEVIAPSLMRGGHAGGQLASVLALVEFQDGTVEKVRTERVKFLGTSEKFNEYDWSITE